MLLYNVTVGIDQSAEQEWLAWMKTEYLPTVMATGLFDHTKIYKVMHDQDDGGVSYSVQHFARTIGDIDTYVQRHAPAHMEMHRTRFLNKVVMFMTLLDEV